jgi:hypothetical protein
MSEVAFPFNTAEEYECLLRLPYLFGPDIDVVELNLSDSTSGSRIKVPGRGANCDHVDVVDVKNSTHAKEEGDLEWICPVCGGEYTHTSEIVVDGLILSILRELEAEDPEGKVRAVNLKIDGDWEHVSENPDERVPMARKKRARLTLAQATAVMGLSSGTGEIVLSDSEDDKPSPRSKVTTSKPDIVDLDSD